MSKRESLSNLAIILQSQKSKWHHLGIEQWYPNQMFPKRLTIELGKSMLNMPAS